MDIVEKKVNETKIIFFPSSNVFAHYEEKREGLRVLRSIHNSYMKNSQENLEKTFRTSGMNLLH